MTKFKVGDRVEVSNEEKARDTGAMVFLGERGTITSLFDENYPDVKMEKSWSIPQDGLRLLKKE